MKHKSILTFLAAVALMALTIAAQAQFTYEKTIDVAANGPYPCAVDSSGGLYSASFDGPDSALYYIADPVNADDVVTTITVSGADSFPSGRGLQGCTVDSVGNVYVSGDFGASSPVGFLKKFGPAPSFTPDGAFSPPADSNLLGCDIYDDDYLVVSTYNSFRFYDTSDGSYLGGLFVDSTSNWQRDVAVNTINKDLYATRNGNNDNGSVVHWSGGDFPDNFGSYSRVTITYIDNLQASSQFGTASLGIGYYEPKNLLMVSNDTGAFDDDTGQLDIYLVNGTAMGAGAIFETSIDGSESGTNLADRCDAVMHNYEGTERLFITDIANNRILVYTRTGAYTGVEDFMLY